MKNFIIKAQKIGFLIFSFAFLSAQQNMKLPKDALLYMEINGKQLNKKMNWEKLNPFFKEISKDEDNKKPSWNDFSKTGIKYDETQYHYASKNDSVYAYTSYFTIDNQSKFKEFINTIKKTGQEITKKAKYEFVDLNDNVFVAWNDRKAVLKMMTYEKPYKYDDMVFADSTTVAVDSVAVTADSAAVAEIEVEKPFDYKEEIQNLKDEIKYLQENIKDSNAEIAKFKKDIKYLEKNHKYPEQPKKVSDSTYKEKSDEEMPLPTPPNKDQSEDDEDEMEDDYDFKAEAIADSLYQKEMDSLNIEKFKIVKKLAEADFDLYFDSSLELEVSKDLLSFRDSHSDMFIYSDYGRIFGNNAYRNLYRDFDVDKILGKINNSNSAYNLYFDDDKVRLISNYQHKNEDINNRFAAVYDGKKNKKLTALINDKSIGYYSLNLNGYKYFDLIYSLFENSGEGAYEKEIQLILETVKIVLDEEAISKIAPGNGIFVLNELKSKKVEYTDYEYDEDYNEKEVKKTKDVTVPEFTFAFATENEKYWNRIFDMLISNKETAKVMTKEGNFYKFKEEKSEGAIEQLYFTIKDGIVYVTTSKENITPKMQSESSKKWTKDAAKYAVSGRFDLQKLLVALDHELTESSEIKLLNLMKKNAGEFIYKSEIKNNSIQTEIDYNIKNAAENSLMYFFNLADEIYKITESEKKNHTL